MLKVLRIAKIMFKNTNVQNMANLRVRYVGGGIFLLIF